MWLVLAACMFAAPARYPSAAVQVVLVRDLDSDGAPELIASGNQVDELSAFSLFRNRGDGTFVAERLIPAGFGQKIEDARDLDGDGIADLLASDYWSNGIALYRGLGALVFDTGRAYGTATHGGPSLVTDYDHDGFPDVVSFSFGSGNLVRLHLFRGSATALDAKRTFETGLSNADTPSVRERAGALEILVTDHSRHLAIVRIADGVPSVSTIATIGEIDRASTFADVDADGIADIVYTTDLGSVVVMLGRADGSFGEPHRLSAPPLPVRLNVGDIDGDGRLDLVVADFRASTLSWFRGHGDGTFETAQPIDAGGPVNAFALADVNGDGSVDVVTANNDHTLSVLINRGPCTAPRHRAAQH